LKRVEPAELVADLAPRQSILITGGTGFIGQRLVSALVAGGHFVTVVTRDLRKADDLAHPVRVITSLDRVHSGDRFDAIVNLAGEPVANWIWTQKKRAKIIQSRVETTEALEALLQRLEHKPDCLINGSAVGWYGLCGDEELTEASGPAPAFVHDVCDAWERSANEIKMLGVRVVILRIGLVLGVEGGMLSRLLTPFELGGGAGLGTGQQWMSWIELDDMVRAIGFALSQKDLEGAVNATAPHPIRNTEFTQALAAALRRPAILRFPAGVLTALLGEMGRETMLGGQRVLPVVLQKKGFIFSHPDLHLALREITGAKPARRASILAQIRARFLPEQN
jgi:uncharacterized protein (TIGR01777 family)